MRRRAEDDLYNLRQKRNRIVRPHPVWPPRVELEEAVNREGLDIVRLDLTLYQHNGLGRLAVWSRDGRDDNDPIEEVDFDTNVPPNIGFALYTQLFPNWDIIDVGFHCRINQSGNLELSNLDYYSADDVDQEIMSGSDNPPPAMADLITHFLNLWSMMEYSTN